jgi:hypothetical protein
MMKTSKNRLATLDIGSHINAAAQARQTAGATQERTLFAVACKRLFGKAPALCEPSSSVPRTPIGSPHPPGGGASGES